MDRETACMYIDNYYYMYFQTMEDCREFAKIYFDKVRDELAQDYIKNAGGEDSIAKRMEELSKLKKDILDKLEETENLDFFERQKEIEPLIARFYRYIIDNYHSDEGIVEYNSILFGPLAVIQHEIFPFKNEIFEEQVFNNDEEKRLYNIVNQVRKDVTMMELRDGRVTHLFTNQCVSCQNRFNELVSSDDEIENFSIDIHNKTGISVANPHVINIVRINGKKYIVDPTYAQFCRILDHASLIDVPGICNAKPGFFLMQKPEDLDFLKELIQKGFFEATDENVKRYFDSFVLASRNRKFYENHPDQSKFDTEFQASDYKSALKGKKIEIGAKNEVWATYDPVGVIRSRIEGCLGLLGDETK